MIKIVLTAKMKSIVDSVAQTIFMLNSDPLPLPPIFQKSMVGKNMKYKSLSETLRKLSFINSVFFKILPAMINAKTGKILLKIIICLSEKLFIIFLSFIIKINRLED